MEKPLVEIPRISAPLPEEFLEQFVRPGRPVVLTGLVTEWPSWGQWNLDWFGRHWGGLTLSGNNSLSGSREVKVRQYLEGLRTESGDGLYLDAMPLSWLPGMAEAIVLPPYLPNDRKTEVLVWVGPGGTCLNFHKDNHTALDGNQNLLCQLFGRKQVLLVSPRDDSKMYPAAQLPNDYLRSRVRLENLADFPLFGEATIHQTEVGPGDMLFIPSHWWHYVRSLETSMTVTFWWRASRVIELLNQFREAARSGQLEGFLLLHEGSLEGRDIEELGGNENLQELWKPLAPRVRALCQRLFSSSVVHLVEA